MRKRRGCIKLEREQCVGIVPIPGGIKKEKKNMFKIVLKKIMKQFQKWLLRFSSGDPWGWLRSSPVGYIRK